MMRVSVDPHYWPWWPRRGLYRVLAVHVFMVMTDVPPVGDNTNWGAPAGLEESIYGILRIRER